jgi:hypothetical protein
MIIFVIFLSWSVSSCKVRKDFAYVYWNFHGFEVSFFNIKKETSNKNID